jgi:hypothetical protein
MCISFQLTVHTDTGVQMLMKTGVRGTLLVDILLFDVLILSFPLLKFVTRASSFISYFLENSQLVFFQALTHTLFTY